MPESSGLPYRVSAARRVRRALLKAIANFAEANGVEQPLVEVELTDTSRFVLEHIDPEPGFGMVTL